MLAQAQGYAATATLGPFLCQQIIYTMVWGWLIFG
jgi:hypothetical protein